MKLRNYKSVALGVSAAALLSMSGQAMAQGYDDTWYAGVGGGWAMSDDVVMTSEDPDDGWFAYGKVGTWTSPNRWRAELELSYREHDFGGVGPNAGGVIAVIPSTINGDFSVTALMFNMLYDFSMNGVSPYVGAGAGGAIVEVAGSTTPATAYVIDEQETVLAGQLMAGLNFNVSENVVFDVGYRYFDTLGADISNGFATREESFAAHIVTAGLRFTFGAPAEPEYVAPPPPPPVAEPKEATFKIYFPFDESRLTSEAQSTVSEIASQYKDKQVIRILVQGNTDTSGSNAYNDRLSQARAASVREGLIAAGIPADWIVTEALGENNPAVQTGDGVKEPLNRRAEVVITLE
jgi:outer membrane protein OmpA-like peptidoglycan-associated protein